MKKLFLYVLVAFFSPRAWSADVPCNDGGKVYKICQDQGELYRSALERAKASGKELVVVFGAEWCPWCHAMHAMLNNPKFDKSFAQKYQVADIGVYTGKEKNASGQKVMAELKEQAKYAEKIDGIPMLAVVNPKTGKAAMINTEPLEKNTKTTKGHDPKKVLAALRKASEGLQ